MSRRIQWAILFVAGIIVGCFMVIALGGTPEAAAAGNPMGHHAGGRFDYIQYDDAMEILTDTRTGQEYMVWFWRDDVEVVPLGTVAEVSE